MSSWHGGKGSKQRAVDKKIYDDNYENIFRKQNKIKSYNLFLDDVRTVENAVITDIGKSLVEVSGIPAENWIIVRDFNSFVSTISHLGLPSVVSFDNDLSKKQTLDYVKFHDVVGYTPDKFKDNGISCARFLKSYCEEKNLMIPKFFVHSFNHTAVPIIKKILT